jgi:hypothetical protein
MSTCLIANNNLADDATVTSSITMSGTRPLTELKKPFLAGLARTVTGVSTGSTEWVLQIDLGSDKSIDLIALYGINSAGAYVAYATGGNAASASYTDVELTGNVSYGSGSSDVAAFGAEIVLPLASAQIVRYIELAVRWSTASGITYYDARRLWIGPALRMSRAASIESGFEIVDRGSVTRSRGERVFASPRKPHKLHQIALRGMSQSEAIGTESTAATNVQKYLADVGLSGEIIILPTLADQHRIHRMGAYGHLDATSRLRPQGRGLYAADLSIRQAPP